MAKGIIVIDIPENCSSCPCSRMDWGSTSEWCSMSGAEIYSGKPADECPIKSIPEKYSINHMMHDVDIDVAIGRNACIDEILGE